MKKNSIIRGSMVVAVFLLAAAYAISLTRSKPGVFVRENAANQKISNDELISADGKGGKKCLVAVDNVVYEIKPSLNWQNGEHTVSDGQAYCGADLSGVIDKSPHGRSKLNGLTQVGTLINE